MPVLLMHLVAVHRLVDRHAALLPRAWSDALRDDVVYARFGAALPLLPTLSGWTGALGLRNRESAAEGFARRFHALAPVRLGLKMAELVSRGALVGEGPGRALLAGYFTHLCVDAAVVPLERGLPRGDPKKLQWAQALDVAAHTFRVREAQSSRQVWRVTKSHRFPLRGMGRGMYELVRIASLDALEEAPTKGQLDRWVRALALHGAWVQGPLGRPRGLPRLSPAASRETVHAVDEGLATCAELIHRLDVMMRSGRFGPRARRAFSDSFPQVGSASCAA